MDDTNDAAREAQRRRILQLPPGERLAEGLASCDVARALMRAGIRSRPPEYTAEDVEAALRRALWGEQLYAMSCPDKPLREL